ncbi:MAG: hypothetical protein H6Q90_4079 [Deltaproteobacteria bacterium]|nr:hypothetical protein [Deltaproteobacteria bacterium]
MNKLAWLVFVCACTKVDSSDILTSGMHADIEAQGAADDTTSVTATLYLGNPINLNFIELTADDQLLVTLGTSSKVMERTELLNIVGYHASFPTNAEGSQFEISLERSVDDGAPSSLATLPAPFTIVPPTATSFSRAAAMTIDCDPAGSAGDQMRWRASGSCIDTKIDTFPGDSGSVTIPASALTKRVAQQGEQVPDSCSATLEITRTREGELDLHYGKGGSVVGTQVRTLSFTTTP